MRPTPSHNLFSVGIRNQWASHKPQAFDYFRRCDVVRPDAGKNFIGNAAGKRQFNQLADGSGGNAARSLACRHATVNLHAALIRGRLEPATADDPAAWN